VFIEALHYTSELGAGYSDALCCFIIETYRDKAKDWKTCTRDLAS